MVSMFGGEGVQNRMVPQQPKQNTFVLTACTVWRVWMASSARVQTKAMRLVSNEYDIIHFTPY